MTPKEVFLCLEAKKPKEMLGNVSMDEIDHIQELYEKMRAEKNV